MILTIANNEFKRLFLTPTAWVILAVLQFIFAWSFFKSIDNFFAIASELEKLSNPPTVTDLIISPLIEFASIIFLMLTPLLTMRLLSEEKRKKTLSLLLSSPVSLSEIVLGKYLGILFFIIIIISMMTLMLSSLSLGAELDYLKLCSGLLGLFLFTSALISAGLFLSSLTDNPLIAAISTFGLLLLLWILSTNSINSSDSINALQYFSLQIHFNPLLRGILNSSDIIYFLLFIILFIGLTIRQLETERLQS